MQATLTVLDAGSGTRADVHVTAPGGQRAATVLDRLRQLVGAEPVAPPYVDGRAIADAVTVADCGLVDGAFVSFGAVTPAAAHHPAAGTTPPRRPPAPRPTEPVVFPITPPAPARVRLPVVAAVAPLLVGCGLAALLHEWQLMAFAVLSPVMIGGQAANDWWGARRHRRRQRQEHSRAWAVAEMRLAAALDAERARRLEAAPSATATVAACAGAAEIWQRRPTGADWLLLRLGLGTLPSDLDVRNAPRPQALAVPITVTPVPSSTIGVVGERDLALGLLRSLLVQAAAWHAPSELDVAVLAPGRAAAWEWVRWLPHTGCLDERGLGRLACDGAAAADLVRSVSTRTGADAGPGALVVTDAGRSADATLPSELPGCGAIWYAESAAQLPVDCDVAIECAAGPQASRLVRADGRIDRFTVETLDPAGAEAAARALASRRDRAAATTGGLPEQVCWSRLNQLDAATPDQLAAAICRRWCTAEAPSLVIGQGCDGPISVDLDRDGPHALVAGTTGAGKSELLRGIVAGLAASQAPDRLGFLLIDFKGGSAFEACALLPHTIGVLTDLDTASTRRALASLAAEIRHREALLAAAGVSDIRDYDPPPGGAALSRLVVIVDEFATLAEELPDFVTGLVGVAQRGRALGIHLILATQRPQGSVSADIRANTRLRICLAVTHEHESRDLIDSPAAARISRHTPGRAYVRLGSAELRECQTGLVSAPAATDEAVTIELSPATLVAHPRAAQRPPAGPTQLDLVVSATRQLAVAAGCAATRRPWLPPLPEHLPLSQLTQPANAEEAVWGLLDLPDRQAQQPARLALGTGGATLIVGAATSGRSTAALTLAVAAAATLSPDDLQLWAIASDTTLDPLAGLPHCGAVVPTSDVARVGRLLDWLTDQVVRRRVSGERAPRLMFLVDGWEQLLAAAGDAASGGVSERLLRLATDGPRAGLRLVVTSDRAGLTGRLGASIAAKVVLRLADHLEFALLGADHRDIPRSLPAGRGFAVTERAMMQVAAPDDAALAMAADWPAPVHPARRFEPLPATVQLARVRPADRSRLVIGVRSDDLAIASIAADAMLGGFLICGPPRSGRSTALLTIGQQLHGRPVAVACGSSSPVTLLPGAVQLPPDGDAATDTLDAMLDSGPPHLLVDDVDLLSTGRLAERIERLLVEPSAAKQVIALAGATDLLAATFRGPVAAARRRRQGLLLRPESRHDGDLFGIRLPTDAVGAPRPPGRGWLVTGSEPTEVQVALPDL